MKRKDTPDDPAGSLRRMVRRIKYSLRKRETYIAIPTEWERCRDHNEERDADLVAQIARLAKCDWLLHTETGEARFFEGF